MRKYRLWKNENLQWIGPKKQQHVKENEDESKL